MSVHTVAQGTMAQALLAVPSDALKAATSSNYLYFDLLDHAESSLMDGELKARVLSSLAWSLDTRAVNMARNVFFDAYRETMETGTIDAFNDFMTAMNERAVAGDHTMEVGFADTDSFSVLVKLLNMRKFWHDRAEANATRRYNPKSLHELVLAEKARTVSADSRAKLGLRAKFAAEGDADLEKMILEMLVGKSNASKQQQHELRQKLNPAVMRILDMAGSKSSLVYDGECPPFHELPVELQASLTKGSIGACERALSDMADMSNVTLDDYTLAIKDARAYTKATETVLAAPKFNVA